MSLKVAVQDEEEDDKLNPVAIAFIGLLGGPFVLLSIGYSLRLLWRHVQGAKPNQAALEQPPEERNFNNVSNVIEALHVAPAASPPPPPQTPHSFNFLDPSSFDIGFDDVAEVGMPSFPSTNPRRKEDIAEAVLSRPSLGPPPRPPPSTGYLLCGMDDASVILGPTACTPTDMRPIGPGADLISYPNNERLATVQATAPTPGPFAIRDEPALHST